MARERSLRRNQVITSFGTGAVVDIGGESFIACDTSMWRRTGDKIRLERLEKRLGMTDGFRLPPTPTGYRQENPPGIPFKRFPSWLFCNGCNRMVKWTWQMEQKLQESDTASIPVCRFCRPARGLIPMRFVMICESDHICDVDWFKWAHSRDDVATRGQCSSENSELHFKTRAGSGSDLKSLVVECRKCSAMRDLGELFQPGLLRQARIYCKGRQPWQRFEEEERCEARLIAVLRGASNIYFPQNISALDISSEDAQQPTSAEEVIRGDNSFETLKKLLDRSGDRNDVAVQTIAGIIAQAAGVTVEQVLETVAPPAQEALEACDPGQVNRDLIVEEWPELNREARRLHLHTIIEPLASNSPATREMKTLFERIVLVPKLREVRVFRGFSRVSPKERPVPADLTGRLQWLPGMEVFGEGIFLALNEDAIGRWLLDNKDALQAHLAIVHSGFEKTGLKGLLSEPSARFILLHTLAHLLMRQLSYDCGYSSASLRERIYSAESESGSPMAGVLIYTADSDSEGSLGGLVRQGRVDRLGQVLLSALSRASWCSSDPICRELEGQGLDGLNRAACHACALVSETSCTHHNVLLDRQIVIGTGNGNECRGFFSGVLEKY